ncbi:F-type H+-transporting ATPase subunit a [Amycolatopsis arida]|uniref:ATP synthase subunit a n=1 Tax=Amycolatopsis arida TaxID=587909 RepID=A0A1I5L8A9_9PSEU|nr:F0F1 ATP synthase subunit A [Amycolatopsis arida]TDX93620.1 F-type H+-transporting ATPase subunit a [Amycolatopsis arida]SFO93413.1 F-type H+-transporting ATPase subunit a [Amycolatopsis arida]
MGALVRAQGEFVAPGAEDFVLPPLFGEGTVVTKPMVLVVLSVVIVAGFFIIASRNLKIVPGKFQFIAESVYDFGRNNIAREQIGSKDFRPFVPLILALFTFILVNNLFGIIPLVQFPTMSHIGFPLALSVLVVYPVYHFVGFRRHGFAGYLKKETVPAGAPAFVLPLLIPIEFLQKFVINPITLALRVFAAMFAGHLLLLVFTLGGTFLLTEASAALKPVSIVSFAFAILLTFLEALIQVLQAYIFALLSANYIGAALATEH